VKLAGMYRCNISDAIMSFYKGLSHLKCTDTWIVVPMAKQLICLFNGHADFHLCNFGHCVLVATARVDDGYGQWQEC